MPGKTQPSVGQERLLPGFNEAPAFMPGKTAWRYPRSASRPSRFNEAPAFMPGKTSQMKTMEFVVSYFRFNEAPAFMPGKTDARP